MGQIKARSHHGVKPAAISPFRLKPDGIRQWSEQAIQIAANKLQANPDWRGERELGSGTPRKTTAKTDKAIVKYVDDHRGRSKVTVGRIKRRLPELRKLSDALVEDRLHDAGLKYLRRRKSSK